MLKSVQEQYIKTETRFYRNYKETDMKLINSSCKRKADIIRKINKIYFKILNK